MKKKVKIPAKKTLVHIEWGDAWTSGPWQPENFPNIQQKPEIVNSIGWVVQVNNQGITIASRVSEDGTYGNVMFIPNGMIMSCTTLTRGYLVNKGK